MSKVHLIESASIAAESDLEMQGEVEKDFFSDMFNIGSYQDGTSLKRL